jgi:para-aminobenzoate synthetase/4-amino-4-deoxychorismate lyase
VLIDLGTHTICSASPELFFDRQGMELRARPMKGSIKRGRSPAEDEERRDLLRGSHKQQAENVMIVDMIRNDLGKVAQTGSVTVADLFEVERYPTVWQMTSCVSARSRASLSQIVGALYPSASVTGAPKRRTMSIICDLEREPRGVYTGAVGYVAPGGDARFNVAIRTALVSHAAATVEFGVGSGIVWDSTAAEEYEECLLKAAILTRPCEPFELLETLRWTPQEGYFLLERHLERLQASAGYFGFSFHLERILAALRQRPDDGPGGALRVRLLLSEDGSVRVERSPHQPRPLPLRVRLATWPIDDTDIFYFHKTTNRRTYESQRLAGVDETILWNRQNQVTEGTTSNVVVKLADALLTPPVHCGLLAGTFRAELLARGEIVERAVTVDDLRRADRIWLINSVQEWQDARLAD